MTDLQILGYETISESKEVDPTDEMNYARHLTQLWRNVQSGSWKVVYFSKTKINDQIFELDIKIEIAQHLYDQENRNDLEFSDTDSIWVFNISSRQYVGEVENAAQSLLGQVWKIDGKLHINQTLSGLTYSVKFSEHHYGNATRGIGDSSF
jgi:hypothetical protein